MADFAPHRQWCRGSHEQQRQGDKDEGTRLALADGFFNLGAPLPGWRPNAFPRAQIRARSPLQTWR